MGLHETNKNRFCTDEGELEIATRTFVRGDFNEILGGSEASLNMQALENVFFDTIYPCPPRS